MKMQNKSGGGCPGVQIEVIVEMPKKSGSGAGVGQVGGCVPRIKDIVKMPKKYGVEWVDAIKNRG